MRILNPSRQMQFESLEQRLALAANLVVDIDRTPAPTAQVALVGNDVYFSTTTGTETQIRRYRNGGLSLLAQHRVFEEFGDSAPKFFEEVGGGLMYGLTNPFFAEDIADATFDIWYASGGAPELIRETPVMGEFGTYQPPTDFVAIKNSLLLRNASSRYELIDVAGDNRDSWSAPTDLICRAPSYNSVRTDGGGVAIDASYSSSCRDFVTPIFAATDGSSFEEVEVHPTSLYLPNGTQVTSAFTRERNATDLIFAGTNRSENVEGPSGVALEPESLTRFGADKVFFTADDRIHGREPWITDGTFLGTKALGDINGLGSSNPQILGQTPLGLVFSATNQANGNELWFTDGTEVGTRLLKDIIPGTTDSNPVNVTDSLDSASLPAEVQSDRIFFWAGTSDRELWSTDGTTGRTQRVTTQVLAGSELTAIASLPNGLSVLGFSDAAGTMQVWKSNGTPAGTRRITSLPSTGRVDRFATSSSNPNSFALQLESNQIWLVNATTAAVQSVWADSLNDRTDGANPKNITELGNRILFTTDADGNKSTVWIWDPATRQLSNLGIIAVPRDKMTIRVLSDQTVLFSGFNAVRALKNGQLSALGSQLVIQHETVGGHSYLLNSQNRLTIVNANLAVTQPDREYFQLTIQDGKLYAINSLHQLVRFDGPNETRVPDIEVPTSVQLVAGPTGSLWVLRDDRIDRLDIARTRFVESASINEPLENVSTNAVGKLFWRSSSSRTLRTITNGAVVNLLALGDLQNVEQTKAVGNQLFFVGTNSRQKRSLWVSDGTASGSRKLANIDGLSNLTTNGSKLFFTGDQSVWESNGSLSGTVRLSTIQSPFVHGTASQLAFVGSNLHFAASDGIRGKELFSVSFSTPAPLPGDANGDGRVGFGDFLVLSANFGTSTTSAGPSLGDFDRDGQVSFADFLLLSANFGSQR